MTWHQSANQHLSIPSQITICLGFGWFGFFLSILNVAFALSFSKLQKINRIAVWLRIKGFWFSPSVKEMLLLSFCKRSQIWLIPELLKPKKSQHFSQSSYLKAPSPKSRFPRSIDTVPDLSWNFSSLLWEALCYKTPEMVPPLSPLSGKAVYKKKNVFLHVSK